MGKYFGTDGFRGEANCGLTADHAAQYYPDLMRRIYLRSYQYNLHILPRSLLVECGAQTNTVEEVQNAMPLLADLLYLVLSGN